MQLSVLLGTVSVLMMDIRIVRMAVGQRCVAVRGCVRLVSIPVEIVRMLMMCIVHVAMRMRERHMRVQVLVAFAQVQPTPAPISPAASQNTNDVWSPTAMIAMAAPMNGAVDEPTTFRGEISKGQLFSSGLPSISADGRCCRCGRVNRIDHRRPVVPTEERPDNQQDNDDGDYPSPQLAPPVFEDRAVGRFNGAPATYVIGAGVAGYLGGVSHDAILVTTLVRATTIAWRAFRRHEKEHTNR